MLLWSEHVNVIPRYRAPLTCSDQGLNPPRISVLLILEAAEVVI